MSFQQMVRHLFAARQVDPKELLNTSIDGLVFAGWGLDLLQPIHCMDAKTSESLRDSHVEVAEEAFDRAVRAIVDDQLRERRSQAGAQRLERRRLYFNALRLRAARALILASEFTMSVAGSVTRGLDR